MTEQIAACQFEPVVGDVDANLTTVYQMVYELDDRVRLATFPELCLTGYDLSTVTEMADSIPGSVSDRISTIAHETGTTIIVGMIESADDGSIYNATVVASPTGELTVYRKQYLWGDEREVFDSGPTTNSVETPLGHLGILCCYDLNFPESALEYSRQGCDIVAVPAAWRTSFLNDWRLLLRARARDGPCYFIGSNHIGDQRGRRHAGHSLIAGPDGEIHAEAGTVPGAVTASVSQSELARERERNPVRETRTRRES